MVNRTINATPAEGLQQHSLLFTTNRTDRTFFCEDCTWHDLHILVTAPFCRDLKARAACAQSLTLWQQATIEIMRRNHSSSTLVIMFNRSEDSTSRDSTPQSLYYCLFVPHILYMGVILHAYAVRGESHIQPNASGEVATLPRYLPALLCFHHFAIIRAFTQSIHISRGLGPRATLSYDDSI